MSQYEEAMARAKAMRETGGHWVIDDDSAQDTLVQQGYVEERREWRRRVLWIFMVKPVAAEACEFIGCANGAEVGQRCRFHYEFHRKEVAR